MGAHRSPTSPEDGPSARQARRRKPDRRRAITRAAILGAASTLFAEQGSQATTVEDIAAGAGTSAATVYFHFQSKDGVIAALIDDALDLATERLFRARDADTPDERIRLFCHAYLQLLVDEPIVGRFATETPGAPGPSSAVRLRELLDIIDQDLVDATKCRHPGAMADTKLWLIATCGGLGALVTRNDTLSATMQEARSALDCALDSILTRQMA